MLHQDTVRIPLYARRDVIQPYVLVDATDAEWANQWRWRLVGRGYAGRSEGRATIYLHRAMLGLVAGDGLEVDHRDRNILNCRRSNMRVVPHAGNTQNVPSQHGSSSAYRGVHWIKSAGKWRAMVTVSGVVINLGLFIDEDEAGRIALATRRQLLPYATD